MTPTTATRRIKTILESLIKLHGVQLDFSGDIDDITAAYGEVVERRDAIIRESRFNDYHQNPEYTKTVMILEAMRLFLREIAPKRVRRKGRVAESTALPASGRDVDETALIQAVEEGIDAEAGDENAAEGAESMSRIKNETKSLLANQVAALREKIEAARRAKATQVVERKSSTGLATLLEAELEKAEVLLAARGMGDDLQKMAEKIASMQVQDLMPLVDRMKQEFDANSADGFNNTLQGVLQAAMDAVKKAKDAIDNEVLRIGGNGGEPANDMASAAPAAPATGNAPTGDDAQGESDMAGMDLGATVPAPEDDMGGDDDLMGNGKIDFPIHSDGFGGAKSVSGPEEEPLGRAKKESRRPTGRMVEGKAVGVKKNFADPLSVDLPAELTAVIDDFEYCIRERRLPIQESRQRSLTRYRRLAEAATQSGDLMVSVQKARETLDHHIAENRSRLDRTTTLNGLVMPDRLREAVETHGLTEDQFRTHLIGYLSEARGKLADDRYAEIVARIADNAERNPAGMASWIANLAEAQAVADITKFDTYQSFTRKLLDEARGKNLRPEDVVGHLKGAEQDVALIASLHEALLTKGFAAAYRDGALRSAKLVAERLRRVKGDAARLAEGLLDRASQIIDEHRTEHKDLDGFGIDLLGQLDGRYQGVRAEFEQALSQHLKAK